MAQLSGSGKFNDSNADGPISVDYKSGTLTIEPRPTIPSVPSVPGGNGWTPPSAPKFNDTIYPFGKGVKWNSSASTNPAEVPRIEWRVVFLEQLQKMQREFLNGGKLEASSGYCVIEDTLDPNQQFYSPGGNQYQAEAPFFIELPVMVPGTGQLLNADASGLGNGEYDGRGEFRPIITGTKFQWIDGSRAATPEAVKAVQDQVRNTPLTWTVTTNPDTKRQTLLINTGKLGTTNQAEGITWEHSNTQQYWPINQLDKLMNDCDKQIQSIQSGANSPITLMDQRQASLLNVLERAAAMDPNDGIKKEAVITAWNEDYRRWRDDERIGPLAEVVDLNGSPVVPLPDINLITACADWPTPGGKDLKYRTEYQDFIKSLENIAKDQPIYRGNRLQYGKDWENAKEHYQKAKAFYENKQIYGFVVKVCSKSINTSMTAYENGVQIYLEEKKWTAEDTTSVSFSTGIVGNYVLGSLVLQKADAYYDTAGNDDTKDIRNVEKNKAGLTGAVFQVYCGDHTDNPPDLNDDHRAYFLDKDASTNGDTYRYTHTGVDPNHQGITGDICDLEANMDGKLILSNITPQHKHWLVETQAPAGYYLDSTPILINSLDTEVTYKMIPNVSRSVLLYKRDSFSGSPVKGAEFTLFKTGAAGAETKVTGFVTKTLNDHQTLWKTADGSGSAALETNANGELCIHGLDAGTYVLRESKPAPGYLTPVLMPEYRFTLSDTLPTQKDDYDGDSHLLLNTTDHPLRNEPDVAVLKLKKKGVDTEKLPGAYFALFRFKGTEEQWSKNPDNESLWEKIALSKDGVNNLYFKTGNTVDKPAEAAATNDEGLLTITDIPLGHYRIEEVKAPDTYVADARHFYFTVNDSSVGKEVRLYTRPLQQDASTELKDNTLTNYHRRSQLVLAKYDEAQGKPEINTNPVNDGWQYGGDALDNVTSGLDGAVYKLFMRRGAVVGQVNPDKEQLLTEVIRPNSSQYDTCLAVGTTNDKGLLSLADMRDMDGLNLSGGLTPGYYYMIEITPPAGYVLDQSPVHFIIDENVYPADTNLPAGLIMAAPNKQMDYGLRLKKVDGENQASLSGAEFTVKQGSDQLYFTRADGKYHRASKGEAGAADTVSTGQDGLLVLTGLQAGTDYTFTETKAPHGYARLTGDITLTTPADMKDGTLEEDILLPKDAAVVTNERLKGKVVLHKQDAETKKALADTEFTLYTTRHTIIQPDDPDYDPANPDAVRSQEIVVRKGVTDQNGDLTFDNLEWDPFYFICETKAPDGYLLDETRRMFVIDENSFDADGNPIPVLFLGVTNVKGTLGEAKLVKADMEDHGNKLEDAHFFLQKKMGMDAAGNEIWAGYGQGIYITNKDGEIRFKLPPGDYMLSEMKAPDGYILEPMKRIPFTIPESMDGNPPPLVTIDDGDNDGVITNRKGGTGVHLHKTIGSSLVPAAGVTFQIGEVEIILGVDGPQIIHKPLSFIPQGAGYYLYTPDENIEGATKDLITNEKGDIYALMPDDWVGGPKLLYCWESAVPDGLQLDSTIREVKLFHGFYNDILVNNKLKDDVKNSFAITVSKADGKSRKALAGAEYTLYWTLQGTDTHFEVGRAVTDQNGNLTFDSTNVNPFPGLMVGETYHLVETKAPVGYVLDETHHEVVLDERCFDENFRFKIPHLSLRNYKIKGALTLKKVDSTDGDKGLAGAEFELLHREDALTEYEHYGDWRYITDDGGMLHIEDLPYGYYRLVERAAPLGYLLSDPAPSVEFTIEKDQEAVDLGIIKNEIDPNPVRDVIVKKVAAEDEMLALPGAEFRLYALAADGTYHLRQQQTYITDKEGGFVIKNLPVGNYALEEVKAPAGYELPENPRRAFAVKVEEREVHLQITNARLENGGGPKDSVTVRKVWKDDGGGKRPDTIKVQLYYSGVPYGPVVELSAANSWAYTWKDLEEGLSWSVDEADVPDGYEKSVSHAGNTWTITNTAATDQPGDPDIPGAPDTPGGPDIPGNPDIPGGPDIPGNPDTPDNIDKTTDFDSPTASDKGTGRFSQTGDDTRLTLWLMLMGLSALGIGLFLSKKRTHKNETHTDD